MKRFSIFILLLSSFLFAKISLAQKVATTKKNYFLSISAGLTTNSVYGTMVERNNQFGSNVKMEKKEGFAINVNIEKPLPYNLFVKTGLNFIHKQVNPMVNTFAIYKDELRTNYLSIPVELGANLIPTQYAVNVAITVGALTNLRISDNSKIGPDRAGFKASFITESIIAGARFSFMASKKSRFLFQYNYIHDLTNTYVESLYYTIGPPTDFTYKYKTHMATLGLLWPLR